jgi:nucleolar protein 56
VIYQYPDLRKAPYWQRGNIARALAGKVLIAAKVDQYKGEFCGDRLNEELKARIADIKRRYPDPPKKKDKPAGKGKGPKGHGKGRRGGPRHN